MSESVASPELVAVIDLGTTSIRMQISEIYPNHEIFSREFMSQGVSIGKDSFARGKISQATTNECIRVLKQYRKKLAEYGISDMKKVRLVATSGVREATNQQAFLDRILIATGFDIEPFDEAELHRVTYLGIQSCFANEADVFSGRSLVAEVGGGSTEILVLNDVDVLASRTFRLGSLRLRQAMESFDAPVSRTRELMEAAISPFVSQIYHLAEERSARYVTMGSEIRMLVLQAGLPMLNDHLVSLPLEFLSNFVDEVLQTPLVRLMKRYSLSQAEADSLGPSLLTHLMIARKLEAGELFVAQTNLRDALVKEFEQGYHWTETVQSQIIRSAMRLGGRYDFDEQHATQVAFIACQLFEQLSDITGLSFRHRLILHLAALLHEIGIFVSPRSYHKHSLYLIRNSELFGVSAADLELIGLVARYHRRARPLATHEGYAQLDRNNRLLVAKLASILRLAVALDVTRQQKVQAVECQVSKSEISIQVSNLMELAIEAAELKSAFLMFEELFGYHVELTSKPYE